MAKWRNEGDRAGFKPEKQNESCWETVHGAIEK